MLKQIEWGVQDGPMTKHRVLPLTTLVFRKKIFSLRTSHKELIWCVRHPDIHIHTFRKRWNFV